MGATSWWSEPIGAYEPAEHQGDLREKTPDERLPERLFLASEVAAGLNVSKARVYELARTKMIPCIRLGRALRFDPDALRRWMDEGGSQ